MRLLIAGGGTGGHIYPALAVAASLRRHEPGVELTWLGGHRGLEASLVREAGIPVRLLALRSLRSVERDVHLVLDPVRLGVSLPQALALLGRERPAAIFTTGGYVALPVVSAAAILRIPVLLWEGNAVPGKSVRAIASLASALAVAFAETCVTLGRGLARRVPCFETGTPIRSAAAGGREGARARLGVPDGLPVVLIFGGSQGVRRFNDAVEAALPELVASRYVIQVAGDGYAAALAARERLPDAIRAHYRPEPFLRAAMGDALAAADLVIGRAGSSTLAEGTAMGIPSVIVPYPHAGGHQRRNAELLAEAGAARLVEDEAFGREALLDAAAIGDDPVLRARMGHAAREKGRPASADVVAELLLVLANRRPLPARIEIERRSREDIA
jgi:UDP-N-acetylglucosamine--N-acetylmuramyl-(pentapeptide) pyrophosphoryl-undecaprenol N-acetylglucosamine transferase